MLLQLTLEFISKRNIICSMQSLELSFCKTCVRVCGGGGGECACFHVCFCPITQNETDLGT